MSSDIQDAVRGLAQRARTAARELARAGRSQKDAALTAVAKRLRQGVPILLEANRADVAQFRESGSSTAAFVDRLTLTEPRIEAVARAVEDIARLEDPVGSVTGMSRRPNGLLIGQVRIPLGVIA